jgi:hypothetical protein
VPGVRNINFPEIPFKKSRDKAAKNHSSPLLLTNLKKTRTIRRDVMIVGAVPDVNFHENPYRMVGTLLFYLSPLNYWPTKTKITSFIGNFCNVSHINFYEF